MSVASLALGYAFIATGIQPYAQAHELDTTAASVRLQIAQEQARQQALQQQMAELQTPEGQQNAARVYGWVLKGEVAISCPTPDNALSHTPDSEFIAAPRPVPEGILQRLRRALEW